MKILVLVVLACGCAHVGPPATRRAPVTDTYHGVRVVDEYRWLEDWEDPEVRSWSEVQSAYARSRLDGLSHMARIRERVGSILRRAPASYTSLSTRPDRLFALKLKPPPKQQPLQSIPKWISSPGTSMMKPMRTLQAMSAWVTSTCVTPCPSLLKHSMANGTGSTAPSPGIRCTRNWYQL